jgi:hypothetical protein
MKFLGPDENGSLGGMLGTIAENRPYEFVSVKYHGFVMNGVEDTTSEAVKKWTGGTENYSFKEVDGSTEVSVELDVAEEMAAEFEVMWPKALEKLRELAEAQ